MQLTKQQLAQEYYKEYIEGVPLTQDEVVDAYVEGAKIAEKKIKKQIKDKYNHLKSLLKEETNPKLTKRLNLDRIKELEIQIKLLKELMQ